MIISEFKNLRRNLKADNSTFRHVKLSLLGDSATQLLSIALRGYAVEEKLVLDVFEADYNQIDHQILDGASEYYTVESDFTLIFKCTQKLKKRFYQTQSELRADFHVFILEEIERYIELISERTNSKVVIINFIETVDEVFGNYALKNSSSFQYQVQEINLGLSKLVQRHKNVFICDLKGLANIYGISKVIDNKIYITSDIVFNVEFLPFIAKSIIDIICACIGKFKKCLILDLDNTLWGGIIGDDGLSNIQIGDLGIGKAFTEFQKWIKELKNRGIILAVCSKNNDLLAKEPFEKHPDMVLRLDDFAMFVANWENKADNIYNIKEALNIGFDSMVFLDDNPFERNLVRNFIPEVCVPELPEDPADYLTYLFSLNLFETSSFTELDKERTRQYIIEAKRAAEKKQFTSEDDFLSSLNMTSEAIEANEFNIPRISQLTQRSNQFNLRTQRYSEDDIVRFAKSDEYRVLSFNLLDKFGDNGLISVIILKRILNSFFIDTWIMSCRVLKRGMEQFVLNKIAEMSLLEGVDLLIGEYIPTPKNEMVKDHYEKLGFAQLDNGQYQLDLKKFTPMGCLISENRKNKHYNGI